ncbi:MAG: peptidylprolyl isomerase [Clostridia bacterium]|nr:peptidylprolyl isomerase [Clostridia bacterium]
MAHKKKNSNYVTEKNITKAAQKEEQKKKEKQAKVTKLALIWTGGVVAFLAVIFVFLLAIGVFKYYPKATNHVDLALDDGSTIHLELYGNDAPITAKHFTDLCNSGYFNGKSIHTLLDGMLYMGSTYNGSLQDGIKGEFSDNGVENKIPMTKGTLCMARADGMDTAYGQFFVLTEDNKELKGKYAAFAAFSDPADLDKLLEKLTVNDDGVVTGGPKISKISILPEDHH